VDRTVKTTIDRSRNEKNSLESDGYATALPDLPRYLC